MVTDEKPRNGLARRLLRIRSLDLAEALPERVKNPLRPRLWRLRQHEPRPMIVPSWYYPPAASITSLRITLATPSFNQGRFVARTVASVLDQGYPGLDYIVQDGGSRDDTLAALRPFGDRIVLRSEPDAGQADAVNRALANARGDILAYLNSDDILLPGTLHYVADFFARHPGVDVVYGHRVVIDEEDREIGRWILPPHSDRAISWADWIPQETIFWRRAIWERVGGVDPSFSFALDWDLITRFRDAGARFVRLPRFLAGFRVHAAQKTAVEIGSTGHREMGRVWQRCLGYVPSEQEVTNRLVPYYLKHLICHHGYRLGWLSY
jgi:glycosyltransferase involved in cell wall biosynthesis